MLRQTKALDSPLFHVTSYAAVASIAEQGLRPRSGAGVFNHGGYGEHSQGRVFLAGDPNAARSWFNKIDDMLDYHAGDPPDPKDGEEETWLWQSARVPVMLRVDGRWRSRAVVDPLGDQDVPGSYYVEATIPPEDIAFWGPVRRSWRPVVEWDDPEPRYGIERIDRDGAVYVKSAQDPGGFKPTKDAQYGPAWKPAPVPKRPKIIRVVWYGKPEETVREILSTINPDRGGTSWMAAWYPSPALNPDGSLNLQFLSLRAQQYGYPEGVEVVGYWHPSMNRRPVERLSTPRRSQAEPRWLPLADVERWVPTMARQGVSKVARSPRGFLPAYRRAGGDPDQLSDIWKRKRAGFIARHMAQVEARGERLVDAQGQPSRRHLALIVWAYSPQPHTAASGVVERLPARRKKPAKFFSQFGYELLVPVGQAAERSDARHKVIQTPDGYLSLFLGKKRDILRYQVIATLRGAFLSTEGLQEATEGIPDSADVAYIDMVESFRPGGGRAMTARALQEAEAAGARAIFLIATPRMDREARRMAPSPVAFWEKMGFEQVLVPRRDVVVMLRMLTGRRAREAEWRS